MSGDGTEINCTHVNKRQTKANLREMKPQTIQRKVRREKEKRRETPEGCVNIRTTLDRYWNTTPQRKRRVLGKMV